MSFLTPAARMRQVSPPQQIKDVLLATLIVFKFPASHRFLQLQKEMEISGCCVWLKYGGSRSTLRPIFSGTLTPAGYRYQYGKCLHQWQLCVAQVFLYNQERTSDIARHEDHGWWQDKEYSLPPQLPMNFRTGSSHSKRCAAVHLPASFTTLN
jgi:hypothetical protein